MDEQYQLVFSGGLLKGRNPEQVATAMAKLLGLPRDKIGAWIADAQRVPVGEPMDLEAAKHLRMQLAALGAVSQIEALDATGHGQAAVSPARKPAVQKQPVTAPIDPHPEQPAPSPRQKLYQWPWLKRFSPLRRRWLLIPEMLLASLVHLVLLMLYALVLLGLLFGVVVPSLGSTWAGGVIGSPLLGLLVQLAAVLLGLLALVILVKPLFSIRPHRYRGVLLRAEYEPDLHAFIEDICERIGTAIPAVIYLDNASRVDAHYYHGPAGFFQRRVVLSLGVPMIAGMNCSQLAAMIAQAMNRFRPRYVPHANSVVLAIQAWLQAALHQPDPIDRQLLQWQQEGRISEVFLGLWQGFFALGHAPLRGMLFVGQLVAHRPVHRILADADKLSLSFAGTEGFLRQLDQLRLLEHSEQEMVPGLTARWQAGEALPDNLVQMMLLQSRQYPSSMAQSLRDAQQQQQRQWASLLPCDNLRLARLTRQQILGSYACLSPAQSLFTQYQKLTRWMTLRYYHHELGLPVTRQQLQQLSAPRSHEAAISAGLESAFAGLYQDFPVLSLKSMFDALSKLEDPEESLHEAQARCEAELEKARYHAKGMQESRGVMRNALSREEIHMAGLWRHWGEARLRRSDLEYLHQQARDAENEYSESQQAQQRFLYAYARRLAAALVLAMRANRSLEEELKLLLGILDRIEQVSMPLRELAQQSLLLEVLLSFQDDPWNRRIRSRIEQRSSDVSTQLLAIGVNLKQAPCPFGNQRKRNLMAYLLAEARDDKRPEGELDRAMDVLNKLPLIQGKLMLRLLEIAGV